MVPHPVPLTSKCPLLFRLVGLSGRPTSHLSSRKTIPTNPVQISGLRSCFLSSYHQFSLNSPAHRTEVYKDLGRSAVGFRKLGFENFRVLGVSNGSSGGTAGDGSGGDNSGGGGGGGSGGGGGGGRGGNNWSLLSWYLTLLEKYPVWTKAVTSAFLTFLGDLICQIVIDQVPSLDLKRTFLFTLLGLVLVGPTLHFWYLYLSKLVTMPGVSGAFLRLVLDQFLFAPIFIGVFLSTLVTLEGRPLEVMPKLRQEWFSSVLANWQLWIPFQFLNFRFVPQQFQVLAANFIALVWNVILSYKAHREVLAK